MLQFLKYKMYMGGGSTGLGNIPEKTQFLFTAFLTYQMTSKEFGHSQMN